MYHLKVSICRYMMKIPVENVTVWGSAGKIGTLALARFMYHGTVCLPVIIVRRKRRVNNADINIEVMVS